MQKKNTMYIILCISIILLYIIKEPLLRNTRKIIYILRKKYANIMHFIKMHTRLLFGKIEL